ENNNLSSGSSSDASDSETGKTGFEPGDVFAIGDIMDEVDFVTELYVLRAQVTNKSYGISTWVRFTNFEVFFDVLVPSTHPNPNA
ncbi:28306_t:CDS:2, partial [Dentiscutata erythropus]